MLLSPIPLSKMRSDLHVIRDLIKGYSRECDYTIGIQIISIHYTTDVHKPHIGTMFKIENSKI